MASVQRCFRCPNCSKKYTRKDNLQRHIREKHPELDTSEPQLSSSLHEKPNESSSQQEVVEHERDEQGETSVLKEDPDSCPEKLEFECDDDELSCIRENWRNIRTHFKRNRKHVDIYTFRIYPPDNVSLDHLIRSIFSEQSTAFKVNLAFGFILKNGGEIRYYYPSQNGFVFDEPTHISNEDELAGFLRKIGDTDWQEYVRQQKPNSQWKISLLSTAAFHIYKLTNHPISRGKDLPSFLVENRGLDALEKSRQTGASYNDDLCYFRCLARHKGFSVKSLEKETKRLRAQYLSKLPENQSTSTRGVTLDDLHRLDDVFGIHTFVYALEPPTDGQRHPVVRLVHRPAKELTKVESNNAMKLNLYGNHFSFIKDMKKYSQCFACSRCKKVFQKPFKLQRHERTCEARVRFQYPGGVYHPPKNIFAKLEEEGIDVRDDLKFSKYMATFDIEVYYPKSHSLRQPKAAKFSWTAEHRLLSVSVASSVPGYEKPKCVIVRGPGDADAQQVVEELITYLNEISDAANAKEQKRYEKLKEVILEKLSPDPINNESSRASTMAEESGMAETVGFDGESDADEEDEDTELDRQFLDDDSDAEEEDASMYRRLDMDRTQSPPSSDPIASQSHAPSSSSLVNTTAYREESGVEEKVEFDTECDTDEEDEEDEETEEDPQENRNLDMDRTQRPPSSDPITTQSHAPFSKQKSKAQKLIAELDQRLRELTVIGFNSGRYDLNVLKRFLLPYLVKNGGVKHTIKKNDSFLALKTDKLKFVDILNFLAAGTSYGQFLGAYGCKQTKGHFPYEWMDSLDKLHDRQLPSQQEFYSWLKKEAISDEDYVSCQDAWKNNDMQTMRDYLVYYNNGDVVPFLEAMEKKRSFWQQQGIDMLKDAVTLPGIAMQFEMGFLKQQRLHLSTFHNEPLYNLFRENMVGGPAIIFKRWAEVNKTNIRDNKEKACEKIVGYDANGLYLWALCESMPVGLYMHWKNSDKNPGKLIAAHSWREADEWLAWEGSQRGISLRTRLNDTEKRLGDRQVSVDGYDAESNTAFEYFGCYWHGCPKCQEADKPHDKRGKTFGYWYDETVAKLQYLKEIGCPTQVKWGCEWEKEKTENLAINELLNREFPGRNQRQKLKTSEKIVQEVRSDTFFGAVEVDIRVPDDLKAKFAEMTPIFKNTKISLKDIDLHMRTFAEDHDCMPRPRRSLIGSYWGNKILLASPLLKFYLEKGLVVSKVHQALQWRDQRCFGRFGDFVSNARREADRPDGSKIKGETAKTLGNSGYGRFIMDVTRHLDVTYVQDESKVARSINNFFFRHLEELDDDVYEIKSAKKRVKMDLPIQIGFFVYQYAKLKMLQFYYDFIDHYLDRADFEYLEMDTDSAYIALAGQSLDELVKPDLKEEYEENKHKWFPRTDTAENKAFDKRTPGLFKIEWQGDGFVGLNSKTYCCWGSDGDKISCKGISKKQNTIKKELYLKVLQTGESEEGENRGFRIVDQRVLTYSQFRTGFSYFYPKRQVLEDGVTTKPLEI